MTARRAANALPCDLLIVTDRHQASRPLPEVVAALVAGGARWIWLRDRDLAADERRAVARELVAIVQPRGAALTVGANVELARSIGAAGVHLRAADQVSGARCRLGSGAVLGVSAHSINDVREAAEAGADYATLSPIFASASKPGYGPALGTAALGEAVKLGIPVLALGGVTAANAAACRAAGAAGVAVMGPAMRDQDLSAFTRL